MASHVRRRSDARLDFRLPLETKTLIEQAAAIRGQSVSDFATGTLAREAELIVRQQHAAELSNRDREIFLAMLDKTDLAPDGPLARAIRRHEEEVL